MRNISVFLFLLLHNIAANFCLAISITFKHVYPCGDHNFPSQTTTQRCTYDKDCPENAYCRNHESCFCMDGYLINRNQTTLECLKIPLEIGDPCTTDVQCRVTFTIQAECQNNVCACSKGSHYEPEPKRCYESIELGKMCQTSYHCHMEDGTPSFCVEGFCTCPLHHHPHGKNCLKSAFLGDQCLTNDECIDLHSQCFGTCTCQMDYVLSSDGKQCLKGAKSMGDPCIEDSQCKTFLKNAKCGDNKSCTSCLTNLKRQGSICFRKMNPHMLGKKCINRTQCVEQTIPETILDDTHVSNVDCINGICLCSQGYIHTDTTNDCIRFSENGTPKSTDVSVFIVFLFMSIYIYLVN